MTFIWYIPVFAHQMVSMVIHALCVCGYNSAIKTNISAAYRPIGAITLLILRTSPTNVCNANESLIGRVIRSILNRRGAQRTITV